MHLRLAQWTRRGRRLIAPRLNRPLVVLVAALAVATACRLARSSQDVTSRWILDPPRPRVNAPARIILELEDPAREPIRGAKLQMAAHMAHPGMAPVVVDAMETVPGSYAIDMQLTMGGDWTIVASGTLADGRRITRSVDIRDVK